MSGFIHICILTFEKTPSVLVHLSSTSLTYLRSFGLDVSQYQGTSIGHLDGYITNSNKLSDYQMTHLWLLGTCGSDTSLRSTVPTVVLPFRLFIQN